MHATVDPEPLSQPPRAPALLAASITGARNGHQFLTKRLVQSVIKASDKFFIVTAGKRSSDCARIGEGNDRVPQGDTLWENAASVRGGYLEVRNKQGKLDLSIDTIALQRAIGARDRKSSELGGSAVVGMAFEFCAELENLLAA